MRRKLLIMLLLAATLLWPLSARADFDDCFISAVIFNCKEYVTLRSWPSSKAPAVDQVRLGEHITLLSRGFNRDGNADFVLVETDRNIGYVLLQYVHAIIDDYYYVQKDHYGIGYGTVTATEPTTHTVLRTGPGMDYPALGYLFGGEVIPSMGIAQADENGRVWYCCALDDTVCWVSSRYTTLRRP